MGKSTLKELAIRNGVTRQTLVRWFQPFWSHIPARKPPDRVSTIVLDGTSIEWRKCTLLIAHDPLQSFPLAWIAVEYERYDTWLLFLAALRARGMEPRFVVCDGQRGLLAAIRAIWPLAQIQRCVIHIHRQSHMWLTRDPKTEAGRTLRTHVDRLLAVRTRRQKRRWVRTFLRWQRRYDCFLKERSWNREGIRWWHTHRKLRAVRSLLRNSLPNLFRYVTHPAEVPRTTNHVEGGLNSRIKELIRSHRGQPVSRRVALASWYLSSRQTQAPTRNVT